MSSRGLLVNSGATRAPRLGNRAAWDARIAKGRPVLLEAALKGVPDTAMLPKAGFPDLPDADVVAATEYMLNSLGVVLSNVSAPVLKNSPRVEMQNPSVDDTTLTAGVAEALRARVIRSAEETVRAVAGVAGVVNCLISADTFEHD